MRRPSCAKSKKTNEQRHDKPTFEVKITLGLVDCVAGEVGSPKTQLDYTVIGDDVNRFFRIATMAEPGKIIVNRALYKVMRGSYEFEKVKPRKFRGVKKKLAIYALK